MIGGVDNNQLFLIDLGLAKKFRNNSEHVPYRRHGMVGTVRYASVNTHREIQQSQRSTINGPESFKSTELFSANSKISGAFFEFVIFGDQIL